MDEGELTGKEFVLTVAKLTANGTIYTADEEEHMSPEEYRKALLEGMKGDVPEEYQTLKKRYYEELVQQ